jgi:hypothetical protein
MGKLPKIEEFKIPEGYFEQLPDQIMGSIKPNLTNTWMRYAATIALFLSVGLWVLYSPQIDSENLSMDEQVDLYIDSQYWTAEDVLSMAENPDEILDQIINEEFPEGEGLWEEEEQTWF